MTPMEYLQHAGLAVEVIGGNLRLRPADRITDAVRLFVREHKPALITEATASLTSNFQKRSEVYTTEAWWRGVLLELKCTNAHLLACGVVTEADITPDALAEYAGQGTTPKAFATTLKRCELWQQAK